MFNWISQIFNWIKQLFGFNVESEEPEEDLEFDEEKEAKIILSKSNKQFVVPKWTPLKDVLPYEMFACKQGYCGTCTVYVQDGEDNLTERKKTERTSGSNRRACQAAVKQGVVKLKA